MTFRKKALIALCSNLGLIIGIRLIDTLSSMLKQHKDDGFLNGYSPREVEYIILQMLVFYCSITVFFSIFCLIFHKGLEKRFTKKTALLSLGLSTAAGVGGSLLVVLLLTSAHTNYPCAIAAVLCFFIFALLFAYYVIERKQHPSRLGVFLDVVCALTYMLPTGILTFFLYAIYVTPFI